MFVMHVCIFTCVCCVRCMLCMLCAYVLCVCASNVCMRVGMLFYVVKALRVLSVCMYVVFSRLCICVSYVKYVMYIQYLRMYLTCDMYVLCVGM